MKNYPKIHNITEKFLNTIKLPGPDGKQLRYLFVMPKVLPEFYVAANLPIGFLLVRFEDMDNAVAKIRSNFHKLMQGRKVAVWPATSKVLSILDVVAPAFMADRNVFLVNKDAKNLRNNLPDWRLNSQSRYDMTGLQIYEPDEIMHSMGIDTILFAHDMNVNSSVYREIVKAVEKYQGVYRIIKISDML